MRIEEIISEQGATGFFWGPAFEDSYIEKKESHPGMDAKYDEFVRVKSADINARFGSKDYPFNSKGNANLAGYMHCHLAGDALLIYRRDGNSIVMVYVATHREINEKNAKTTVKKFKTG